MKVHAIPHAIVEPTRPGFIQILHHCSAEFMKDNSSVFFQLKPYILRAKSACEWLGENLPNSSCKFETSTQFSFKLCITFHCHER